MPKVVAVANIYVVNQLLNGNFNGKQFSIFSNSDLD